MTGLHALGRKIERLGALDAAARPVIAVAQRVVKPRVVRNLLSGTWLGHPLHPMLTDLPIGAWTMSVALDSFGGRAAERGADLLVAGGIAAAVPTAASGLNDWSDTYGPETRVGFVHAVANATALGLFAASSLARARGQRARGKAFARAGLGVLLVGGYLGGHLTFVRGVNVNRTAWSEGPHEWTPVMRADELREETPHRVDAMGTPVLVYAHEGEVYALAATCSHMGGPLDEGTFTDGCVRCPWHGSTFRLADGHIKRGPASTPQPHYETRINNGQIEVRLAVGRRHPMRTSVPSRGHAAHTSSRI